MPPAARVGDLHACPAPTHVGGPVTLGSATVIIGGAAAARLGDQASCHGAVDTLTQGSSTVFIEGRPAARAGDTCRHAGTILTGCETVIIGNSSYNGGVGGGSAGSGSDPGTAGSGPSTAGGASDATLNGKKVSPQVLTSMVSIARGIASGADDPMTLNTLATALEVALARADFGAIQQSAAGIQEILQKARNKPKDKEPNPPSADDAGGAASPSAQKASWAEPVLADPPRSVAVRDGRLVVNGHSGGIHAISEFDLIALQAAGDVHQVVQRLGVASAAGRNCARVFCMYRHAGGELSPVTTPRYWESMDLVIKRLNAYGMFPELVLFADCELRADGTGAVMPSWDARKTFAREAGQVLKGRSVIVNGMNEPYRNGAAGPDDPRLLEIMTVFHEASGGSVPFSVGDPSRPSGASIESTRAAQQAAATAGASLIVLHERGDGSPGRAYRPWLDRLPDLANLRPVLSGQPYLYHNQPIGFASRAVRDSRDDDPEAAVAAACLCAIGQMGFCYHRVAAEDPATPGLELTRVATLVPQSPDFNPVTPGATDAPIGRYDERDAPEGGFAACSNGVDTWAVMYGRRVSKTPRVDWRGRTPQVIWQGERVVLWHVRS